MPSHHLTPLDPGSRAPLAPPAAPFKPGWEPAPPPAPVSAPPWRQALRAVRRFWWLLPAFAVVGAGAGFVLGRQQTQSFAVQATVWISSESPSNNSGPIRAGELLSGQSWPELLRSYAILDSVSRTTRLYLRPSRLTRDPAFAGFELGTPFRPGTYTLTADASQRSWTLAPVQPTAGTPEKGAAGDSVGRSFGFRWQPDAAALARLGTVTFTVTTPREASVALNNRLGINRQPESNLMRLSLADEDARTASTTLNTLVRRFVDAATDLKKRNLIEVRRTLEQQLDYAARELRDAEIALETFRVNTITLPSEGGPVAAGVELSRDPVMQNFFRQKIEYDNIRQDREALSRAIADVRRGAADPSVLWSVPSIQQAPEALRAALTDFASKEAALRAARQVYTEEAKPVRDLSEALAQLRGVTIPQLATAFAQQLGSREADLTQRIGSASRELRVIPSRTIEEQRLRRNVEVRAALYTTLRNRYTEASLAEGSAMPDLTVLDTAVAPQGGGGGDSALKLMLLAVVAAIGAAAALAFVLDRLDKRLRYPEQASTELGLGILGAVPLIDLKRRRSRQDPNQVVQVVESFRSLRVNIVFAFPPGTPVVITVTSAGMGEGKSLVSANLALSFAEAGYRTVLVDGDVRRGTQHDTFGIERLPGLTEFLQDGTAVSEIVRATSHERLWLVPCGTRHRRAPELLQGPRLPGFLSDLTSLYDVVIVDSPPLGAGIDGYVLAAATGSMMMVLRTGTTDRKLAAAKLELMDRLPVRILGAVLNDVRTDGAFEYYAYLSGYEGNDEHDPRLEPVAGSLSGRNG